jgi:DNA-binding MarR family transcriptional regulator
MDRDSKKNVERIVSIHRRIRDLQLFTLKKHFSSGEFFLMSRIYMLAQDNGVAEAGVYVSMKKLSAEANLSPAMMTKTVSALEEKGCVTRALDGNDRRGVNVCLTEEGLSLWQEELSLRSEAIDNSFKRLGEEKTDMLFSLSEELAELLEDENLKTLERHASEKETTKKG